VRRDCSELRVGFLKDFAALRASITVLTKPPRGLFAARGASRRYQTFTGYLFIAIKNALDYTFVTV
jgi:hypothetical protein